jgi:hypothetical protein
MTLQTQLNFTHKKERQIRIQPLNIDFAKRKENNHVSQDLLNRFCRRISNQNQKVLIYLTFGHTITFDMMYQKERIKHLPRRVKDLEEFLGLRAERDYDDIGSAHYYFSEDTRIKAMKILKGI